MSHHTRRFRRLLWSAGMFALATGLIGSAPPTNQALAQGGRPVVHVFLQVDAKSSVVEKALQSRLPGLNVTVFARFRDFDEASSRSAPDAILSVTPVLEARGRRPTLQGTRGGKGTEAYVLASVGQPLGESLSGKTIGVVDLLNREGTQRFFAGLLKSTDVKWKRVAKIEDLLPLLEFSAADGVVLPQSILTKFMGRTRLAVKTRELPGAQVGLPAVAVLNATARDTVVNAFQKLDGQTKSMLGIDDWSTR